jgi:hypothetical protein
VVAVEVDVGVVVSLTVAEMAVVVAAVAVDGVAAAGSS